MARCAQKLARVRRAAKGKRTHKKMQSLGRALAAYNKCRKGGRGGSTRRRRRSGRRRKQRMCPC